MLINYRLGGDDNVPEDEKVLKRFAKEQAKKLKRQKFALEDNMV